MAKFITGTNNGWFLDKYAADLGYNQFSGTELWHWPYNDPIPIDLTKPDPNPPRPWLSDHPELIEQYFSQVQGLDVVRIWVFERLEGIRFDANRKIIGIDPELTSNLLKILNSASLHGIRVYLCLFDSWVVKHQPLQGLPADRIDEYNSWNAAIRNIMKSIVDDPFDFTHNVLQPLVSSIAAHPAVYAIDVMNEPEGMVQDTPVVSNSSMRNYISQCCSVIRPQLKASVGCMRSGTAKGYSDLPVDFCDFHSYDESASLTAYNAGSYNNKPCIVGECGYPVNGSNSSTRAAKEVQTAKDYVNLALSKGYSGCLVWDQDFTSDANKAAIEQWLVQFASSNNQVQPAPKMSFWEWLLSLFGM